MAAFTAPHANGDAMKTNVAQAAWQREGGSNKANTCKSNWSKNSENGDVAQNTILEKTHEFFQMCDIENKGFITQRDMQVSLTALELLDSNTLNLV